MAHLPQRPVVKENTIESALDMQGFLVIAREEGAQLGSLAIDAAQVRIGDEIVVPSAYAQQLVESKEPGVPSPGVRSGGPGGTPAPE